MYIIYSFLLVTNSPPSNHSPPSPRSVLIIGAGKMSTLLVKHLASKGCKEVTVLNRSMPRAEALAAEFPDVKFNIFLMDSLMKVRQWLAEV